MRVAPLRHIAQAAPGPKPELVAPAPALRLRFNQNKDTPLPAEEPGGENPPTGAVLDYILPEDFSGQVRLEILAEDGSLVRAFDSESAPERAKARVYVADTWLGQPRALAATPGHHRFVWDLRYAPPPTLDAKYSIAAVPGRETPILPQGAFVLPGEYSVQLISADGSATQALTVVMDPRVDASPADLAALLDFQQQVDALLRRAVFRGNRNLRCASGGGNIKSGDWRALGGERPDRVGDRPGEHGCAAHGAATRITSV